MPVVKIAAHRATPKIDRDGFSLRPIEIGDSELLRSWRLSPETCASFPAVTITKAGHAAWLSRHLAGGDGWMWIIQRDDATSTPIGCIAIVHLDADVWEIGRVIVAPEYRGASWGRKAIASCVDVARSHGHAAMVEVMPHNSRMLTLCKSLGFIEQEERGSQGMVRLIAD